MTRQGRIWAGMTVIGVIVLNYTLVGIPLFTKTSLLESHYKGILIKQAKSGMAVKGNADAYMLELLRKEREGVDKRILILNCVSASVFFVAASWTLFGVLAVRKK